MVPQPRGEMTVADSLSVGPLIVRNATGSAVALDEALPAPGPGRVRVLLRLPVDVPARFARSSIQLRVRVGVRTAPGYGQAQAWPVTETTYTAVNDQASVSVSLLRPTRPWW
jgi:hypothetical protein